MSSNAYIAMTHMGRGEGYLVYTDECAAASIAPMSFVFWSNSIDNVFPPAPVQDEDAEEEEDQEDPELSTLDNEESEDPL